MKLTHTIPLIIATACFAITGCDKKNGADSGGIKDDKQRT